jgi:hypothetical protein
MSLDFPTMPPRVALITDADEAARRAWLVERYNSLAGKPKKITKTIQKQFLMGFMGQDETEALRGFYNCWIAAMESVLRSSDAG